MSSDRGYILDTNVIVHLIRNNELGRYINATYNLSDALQRAVISVVTIGEMYSLAEHRNWGQTKIKQLENILKEIVWIDINRNDILRAYGEIESATRRNGHQLGKNDIWIAATANVTGMTLLTTDKDFDHAHPKFINRIWIDPKSTHT